MGMRRHSVTYVGALVAAAGLALTLTACSGGDEVADFCDKGEAAFADVSDTSALADPTAVQEYFGNLAESMGSLRAPSEISGDWDRMTTYMEDAAAALDGVDTSDTLAFSEALSGLADESGEVQEASDRVDAFLAENCT